MSVMSGYTSKPTSEDMARGYKLACKAQAADTVAGNDGFLDALASTARLKKRLYRAFV